MDSVYVMQKIYPYEDSCIMGIYSSMEDAKKAIQPRIEKQNLEQYMRAAFYRWKKLVKNEKMYVSNRFYQLRNTWVLIKDTPYEIIWHEQYSRIHINEYQIGKSTTFFYI